jgi:hypothetical protein
VQGDIIFGAVEGVYGPQNTPMLWQFIIAGTKEHFEGQKHPQPPPKNTSTSLGGCHPCTRGPFLPAAAMVVAVVMPVVFSAKATEKRNKNTKIRWWLPKKNDNYIL